MTHQADSNAPIEVLQIMVEQGILHSDPGSMAQEAGNYELRERRESENRPHPLSSRSRVAGSPVPVSRFAERGSGVLEPCIRKVRRRNSAPEASRFKKNGLALNTRAEL